MPGFQILFGLALFLTVALLVRGLVRATPEFRAGRAFRLMAGETGTVLMIAVAVLGLAVAGQGLAASALAS
jgi:hypothetical protein